MKTVRIIIDIKLDTESEEEAKKEVKKWLDNNELYDFDTLYYRKMRNIEIQFPLTVFES